METDETVREVCATIRTFGDYEMKSWYHIKTIINNIEHIYEREMAAKDAEIARFKAALKPVMEFSLQNLQSNPMSAVREAQRIMKESFNDESHN